MRHPTVTRWAALLALSSIILAALPIVRGANDDAAGDDAAAAGDDYYAGDDAADDYAVADDAAAAGDDADGSGYVDYSQADDYIKYWTDYAILPRRCIKYNDVDVIVFQVFEHGYKQCSDEAMGTYITPVPRFVGAYLDQVEANQADMGNADDYVAPAAADYVYCTRQVIQNKEYYLQLGCNDDDTHDLAVNIYSDNTCETPSEEDGFDDSNIEVDIELPFKKCQACVTWVDKNDDEIDDQFYENRQIDAPLCSTVWQYKDECDKTCQRTGREKNVKDGWNTSDKVLLSIMSLFGAGMLIAILKKRQKMSNKEALLEQAAMSAAGLQQSHIIAIFVLVILIIVMFALLNLKNVTWALLLLMNITLFAYLMKLTVDSGVSKPETIIGPDGTLIQRKDSDDSSVESHGEDPETPKPGYQVPEIS